MIIAIHYLQNRAELEEKKAEQLQKQVGNCFHKFIIARKVGPTDENITAN